MAVDGEDGNRARRMVHFSAGHVFAVPAPGIVCALPQAGAERTAEKGIFKIR